MVFLPSPYMMRLIILITGILALLGGGIALCSSHRADQRAAPGYLVLGIGLILVALVL